MGCLVEAWGGREEGNLLQNCKWGVSLEFGISEGKVYDYSRLGEFV